MISIVVPVYNAGDSINNCIMSVENNDFSDWELILIDDCSTDNTVSIIRNILNNISDERIKLITLTKNVRAGGARNRGIIEAKGEYIFFLDQDDVITTNALTMLYAESENGKLDQIYGDIQENNGEVYRRVHLSERTNLSDDERICILNNVGYVFGRLIKRSILLENELFFPQDLMFEDVLWGCRLVDCIKTNVSVAEVVVERHGTQSSQTAHLNYMKLVDRQKSAQWYMERMEIDHVLEPYVWAHFTYYVYTSMVDFSFAIRGGSRLVKTGLQLISEKGIDVEWLKKLYVSYSEADIKRFMNIYHNFNFYYIYKMKYLIFHQLPYLVYKYSGLRKAWKTIKKRMNR